MSLSKAIYLMVFYTPVNMLNFDAVKNSLVDCAEAIQDVLKIVIWFIMEFIKVKKWLIF